MKKLLLFLLISIGLSAFSDELKDYLKAPKWSDFCEAGYENAVYKRSDDVFNVFSFVKAERVKKNYWAQRRESFEKYLNSCNLLTDDTKYNCYQELVDAEKEKNKLYNTKREQLLYENNIQR